MQLFFRKSLPMPNVCADIDDEHGTTQCQRHCTRNVVKFNCLKLLKRYMNSTSMDETFGEPSLFRSVGFYRLESFHFSLIFQCRIFA